MTKLVVLSDPALIELVGVHLDDKAFIAVDTETTGVGKEAIVVGASFCGDVGIAHYAVTHTWDPVDKVLVPHPANIAAVKKVLQTLPGKALVMHNGLFDCEKIETNYGIRLIDSLHTDTMILAHLLDENRPVGLKELAGARYGADSTKEAQEMKASVIANGGEWSVRNKEMYKADPQLLGKYGAQDTALTLRLFYDMVEELYEQRLDKFFYEDESMPLLRGSTYELNATGLKVDQPKLLALKQTLIAEIEEARAFVYQEITPHVKAKYPGTNKKNTFNIGAGQQLSWLLFGVLGLEFGVLTKGGKDLCKQMGWRVPYHPAGKRDLLATLEREAGAILEPASVVNGKKKAAKKIKQPWAYIAADKAILKKHAVKYKWIEKLLELRAKEKLLSTYVEGIQERMQYGIIHPSFLQHGTTSGRYSSRNPNFQNLPRDDRRVKSCIISRPGKSFVGADYSQLEPRVFAYFSNDARLLDAFKGADDFYSVIGMEVFEKTDCVPRKEGSDDAFGVKYKKLRDISKVIALSSTYGSTAFKLAGTIGKSVDDTQADIDSYFEKFPGVKRMMIESHEMAKKQGWVENLFGRKRRIPEAMRINRIYGNKPHAELPYEARSLLNLSINHRIQSTGASIMNRAAIAFRNLCKEAGIEAKVVLQVHDQLVAECDDKDAEDVAVLMQHAMENTTILPTIALEAVPKVGKNLAEL